MSRRAAAALALAGALALPSGLGAQGLPGVPRLPVALELRGGAELPLGDLAGPTFDAGSGHGVSIGARLFPGAPLSPYGRYAYGDMGCAGCVDAGLDGSVQTAGWELGARARLPWRPAGLGAWVSGGVALQRMQLTGLGGSLTSERAAGLAAAAGLSAPLGPLQLTPGVRFRRFAAEFGLSGLGFPAEPPRRFDVATDVALLSLDLGVEYHF